MKGFKDLSEDIKMFTLESWIKGSLKKKNLALYETYV